MSVAGQYTERTSDFDQALTRTSYIDTMHGETMSQRQRMKWPFD